jgi:hypothetical protein
VHIPFRYRSGFRGSEFRAWRPAISSGIEQDSQNFELDKFWAES